jgi:large subunit ribosomal protein L4
MAVVSVYDQNKQEAGKIELAPEVFEIAVRPEILHFVVRSQLAARRAGTHAVKTRAFVSGGGRKPYRQKGTGNARAGSNRSPIWRGGAVVFGPQPRDYSFKVNKKIRKLALRMALSARLASDRLMVVKSIELPEIKTRNFVRIASALGLDKALIVTAQMQRNLELSARNVPGVSLTTPDKLSVYEIMRHKQLVLLEGAVEPVAVRLK